ncbi:HNH endonuclease [Escherichia coli]|uniref:HNH endonuclease signature motif containing protein n=1 Tax=Enterobacteriaceae TaxID=543 RepID=UPI0002CB5828|nr:HNH endonuclease signature motif containing protein [Escherichia coli]EFN8438383.1 HNH endonuclease [Escherichia coli O119]EHO3346887.1 HNH endonuclease [Salmonella enterica subsp. enterica serovar Chester]HCR8239090.1 HNH endonuclease [Shigella flexneri]EEX1842186.1 HNH endonuclease [Escherichia coli]EFO3706893.1 HNH endonuclease [Escherichia coli]
MKPNLISRKQYQHLKNELNRLESLPYRRGNNPTNLRILKLREDLTNSLVESRKRNSKKINGGNVSCIICKKNFKSAHGLYEHYRAKHSNMIEHPTSLFNKEINGNTTLLESISHPVTKGIPIAEHDKKISSITLNRETKYFNVDAYNLACLSLTKSEAIKIAKDELLSRQFLGQKNILEPTLPPVIFINPSDTISIPVVTKGNTHLQTVLQRDSGEQVDFKKRVLKNFSNVCAITGYNLPVLQACHLEPFSQTQNHRTNNGIPLEPTLHALLDRGLLAIHPDNLTIHFAIDCYYKNIYEGKNIKPHKIDLDKNSLLIIWKNFLLNVKNSQP